MILSQLTQELDLRIDIFTKDDHFYVGEDQKINLDQQDHSGLKKRLIFYRNWCRKNQRSLSFDIICIKDQSVWVRSCFVDLRDNEYWFKLYPALPMKSSSFGKSLSYLDSINEPVLITEAEPIDEPGPRIFYSNQAFEDLTGYTFKEYVGKSPRFLQGDDSSDEARKKIRAALEKWEHVVEEIKNYKKNGDPFYTQLNITPISDEAGWWSHWISFQRDITKEKSLRSINEKLQDIGKIGFWSLNVKTQETTWSDEVYRIYGLKPGTPTETYKDIKFYSEKDQPKIEKYVMECIQQKNKFDDIFEFTDAQGNFKWVRSYGEPIIESTGEVLEICGVFQDVTEIVKEKKMLSTLLDSAPDLFFQITEDSKILYVSKAWSTVLGYSFEESVGKNFWNFLHREDVELAQAEVSHVLDNSKERTSFDVRFVTKNGDLRWMRTVGLRPIGQSKIFQGISSDITREKDLKLEIRSILDATSIGVWHWDIKKNELVWDESMYRVFDINQDDFSGVFDAWSSTLHPEDRDWCNEEVAKALRGEIKFDTTFRIITKNGETRYIKGYADVIRGLNGEPLVMRGVNFDRTSEVLMEKLKEEETKKNLIQSRLASIGELAAGVGHEINNPLAIAMGKLEQMKQALHEKGICAEQLKTIEEAHRRIQRITSGLRNFSRTETVRSSYNLKEALQESVDFIKDIYRVSGVAVDYTPSEDSPLYINGNRGEIQQVIMNILSNAKDATEGQNERKIKVTIFENNHVVTIKIWDNGPGIPEDVKDKIFNPFFTTKGVGKGTGIGLSLSSQIITDHKGELRFETSPTHGTCFIIDLPQSSAPDVTQSAATEEIKPQTLSNKPKILVVDDEEDLREILCYMLKKNGCVTDVAHDGLAALEKIKTTHYDLVVSDVQMPKLSGPDLLLKVYDDPNINQPPFVFITGGTSIEESEASKRAEKLSKGTLKKPFTQHEVVEMIRGVLK